MKSEVKTFLILGGYGTAGLNLARLLIQHTPSKVILAGRNRERAEQTAQELNREFTGDRASGGFADAEHQETIVTALRRGVDMLVVCSTSNSGVEPIARAALEVGVDYLDILYPAHVVATLEKLRSEIEHSGSCFITQAGVHPGLSAPLIIKAASQFTHCCKAQAAIKINSPTMGSRAAVMELLADMDAFKPGFYRNGKWQSCSYKDSRKFDFGVLGVHPCIPMDLPELKPLPERFGLEEVGLWMAGFNWFVDYVVFSICAMFAKIGKGFGLGLVADLFDWGMKTFSRPPFGIVCKVEVDGEQNGMEKKLEISIFHTDGYFFTASAVAACLMQYLEQKNVKPGLHLMGLWVDADRLLEDMKQMGIESQTRELPL